MKIATTLLRMKRPITVLVEGNIGAGKSLFLDRFKDVPGIQILPEPVNKWRDVKGSNLLQLMYEDPVRHALTFQTYVQLTMVEQHLQVGAPVKLMERSLYSARYCFVNNLRNNEKLQQSEVEVLDAWFQYLISDESQFRTGVDLIVYMKTEPETAYERLKQRNRGEENLISLQYVKDLHCLHEKWLYDGEYPVPAPVFTIDANKQEHQLQPDFEMVRSKLNELIKQKVDQNSQNEMSFLS